MRPACGPRERFVRPAMLFGNFQIISIYIIYVIVSSPVFKSARLASEQVPNERTIQTKFACNSFPSAKNIYTFFILLNHSENTGRPT